MRKEIKVKRLSQLKPGNSLISFKDYIKSMIDEEPYIEAKVIKIENKFVYYTYDNGHTVHSQNFKGNIFYKIVPKYVNIPKEPL